MEARPKLNATHFARDRRLDGEARARLQVRAENQFGQAKVVGEGGVALA